MASAPYPENMRKEGAKKGGVGFGWNEKARAQGLSPAQIDLELDDVESAVKKLEADDKLLRKTLRDKLTIQSACRLEHRQLSRTNQINRQESDLRSLRKAAYKNLQVTRAEVRHVQSLAEPLQASLRSMRQERYYWNNVLRAAKDRRKPQRKKPQRKKPPERTVPTAADYKYEDMAKCIDLSQLPRRRLLSAGTDPGGRENECHLPTNAR